ncbi:hypothetical protein ACWIGI_24900 [Nocardia sp. NPDC055321]
MSGDREFTLTLTSGDSDWQAVHDAAECAGMSVEGYIRWLVRILVQAASGSGTTHHTPLAKGPRAGAALPEPEAAGWDETFSERLVQRAAQFRLGETATGSTTMPDSER